MKLKKIISVAMTAMVFFVLLCSITVSAIIVNPTRGILEDDIWLKEKPQLRDYAYSIAVIGDTEVLSAKYPSKLSGIYDWLVSNKSGKKIEFVIGLGDITQSSTPNEWSAATSAIKKLNGVIPYSLTRGETDSSASYKQYITKEEFGGSVSGAYDDTMLNTYSKFTVGDVKYMVLSLDLTAPDAVLEWAGNIISENTDYNVIVATHIYMYDNGARYDRLQTTVYGTKNDAKALWEKLLSKHSNIIMVICGHSSSDRVSVKKTYGDSGNEIIEMLVAPQNIDYEWEGAGVVCMLYFSEDGKRAEVEYYSPSKDRYYLPINNSFDFEVDVIEQQQNDLQDIKDFDVSTDNNNTGKKIIDDDVIITIIISAAFVIIASILAVAFIPNKKSGK